MKKVIAILFALLLPALACADALPVYDYAWSGTKVRSYDTETLKYTVEVGKVDTTRCFVSKIWMQEPGKQIKKATGKWHEHLAMPEDMAMAVPGAALVVNGSGYVSPMFPEIPDNYPGTSEDYHYTPLGSITVTDGEVFRNLEGVPYYGLTLEADGLHMYVGADNEEVLARDPQQTWSFYERCPMILDHQSILDTEWPFANRKAIRTIIAKMDDNNYVILTVTSSHGLTLVRAVEFLMEAFDPEWAYDLDGGPSSALMCRNVGKKKFKIIYGGERKDADVMAFTELTE